MKGLGRFVLVLAVMTFLGTGGYLAYEFFTEGKDQGDLNKLSQMVEQHSEGVQTNETGAEPGAEPTEEAPRPVGLEVTLKAQDAPLPASRQRNMDELAEMVRDFFEDNYAFENQAIEMIRLDIRQVAAPAGEEQGDAAAPAPIEEEPKASVRILIDGQAVLSERKQNQVDRLASMIEEYIAEDPDWTVRNEIIDFDVNIARAPILEQYRALYEQNPDMIGWIKIEGTRVNYPVMQTKEDPEFYLRTNFEKEYAYSGLPFLDARCDLSETNINLLVYGHNMKSGNMFGQLPQYESASFWKSHPTIQFDLLNEKREYEVMSAFRSRQYKEGESGFRYYDYIDLSEWSVFSDYVRQVEAASFRDPGFTAQWGDELLTLSTCSYHANAGTFVVVAKRVK